MGTALLNGIVTSKGVREGPVKKYLACVRREEVAGKLRDQFAQQKDLVEVFCNDNLRAIGGATIVVLGIRPSEVNVVLGDSAVADALRGRIIVSMIAGVSCSKIEEVLVAGSKERHNYRVSRVIPSIGAQIGQSVSFIASAKQDDAATSLVSWIFGKVGSVHPVAESLLDVYVAVSATCHALAVTAVDALTDGSVSRGVPRAEALQIAARCLHSATSLLLEEMTLEELKDSMSVPKGITTEAWISLDAGHVRPAISQSVRHAVDYAARMA